MTIFLINLLVSFVLALVLHELGHYVAARACHVPVTQAGLGWGPKLMSFKLSNVDCHLRVLPLGAYVRMDLLALQSRPLMQQLIVLGAGVAVNLLFSFVAWGTLFGVLNLALAIGNILPLYQHDGWKSGIVISRRILGRSELVEWTFTLSSGLVGLVLFARAFSF